MPCFTPISRDILLFFSALFLIAGCSSTTSPKVDMNLNGSFSRVASIPAVPTKAVHSNAGMVLAGTAEGAYKKALGEGEWTASGLQSDSTEVVDFILLNEQEIWAAIRYDNFEVGSDKFNANTPMLFKSMDSGESWNPDYSTAIPEVARFAISDLERGSQKVFVYRAHVISSTNQGETWSVSFDKGAAPEFLKVSNFHPNHIWAGGWTTLFAPYIAKSEDGGESWTLLNENFFFAEAIVYDVIIHPDDADRVLAGTGGTVSPANVIRRSTDGGQSWETVYEGVNTRTFTHSARNPHIIYASGRNADGSLFFLASGDFGDTWEMVKMEGEPLLVQINDMISVVEDGKEVLYFATEQGVFSYTFEE